MEVVLLKPTELIPYARNARKISQTAIDKVAASIKEFGFRQPIVVDEEKVILAGHTRLLAAQKLELVQVPVHIATNLTEAQYKAYRLADNRTGEEATWDDGLLKIELEELQSMDFDLPEIADLTGFEVKEIEFSMSGISGEGEPQKATEGDDDTSDVRRGDIKSQEGEIYQLGSHLLMCGDSTDPDMIQAIMCGDKASLLHADPPYGMGKEGDGVLNDNLYREKLDAFQMLWYEACRPYLEENASMYIWGNAPDLWRLWYTGGLNQAENLMVRNEIVWDKATAPGMNSEQGHQYVTVTERALFLMLGNQFLGNVNTEDFWEGYQDLLDYLQIERDKMHWKAADINRITGSHMAGHWFSKSQFAVISKKAYEDLAEAAEGKAFLMDHNDLERMNTTGKTFAEEIGERRSYFDNTHEIMSDVWQYPRVIGEERHGHATPKPVDMMARAINSSCEPGGLVLEPFGGSGTTLIAAAKTGRKCRMMELDPYYCDIIRMRWYKWAMLNGHEVGAGGIEN